MNILPVIMGVGSPVDMWVERNKQMAKWMHARKGEIEGEIIREDEEWVDIELSKRTRITYANNILYAGHGIPYSHAAKGQVIRVRKSLLTAADKARTGAVDV